MENQYIASEVHIWRRKARKRHTCAECGKKIDPKELYIETKRVEDFRIVIIRYHLDCYYSEDWEETTDWEIENAEQWRWVND